MPKQYSFTIPPSVVVLETVAKNTPNFPTEQYVPGGLLNLADDYCLVNLEFDKEVEEFGNNCNESLRRAAMQLEQEISESTEQQGDVLVGIATIGDNGDFEPLFDIFRKYGVTITPITV
jgi:hypothetical protein